MKLYHYIPKGNNAREDGILSFANNPHADITYYTKRSGSCTKRGIINWMENCFEGRSRAIRGFTEPIQWHNDCLSLKEFTQNADLFSIDLDAIKRDDLIESIWHSPSVLKISGITEDNCFDEILHKLDSINQIDYSPIAWHECNDKLNRRFAFVDYYLIVVKNGIIPPKYIQKEN